jgi:hypothetical protein
MMGFLKKTSKGRKLDIHVLRENDISLLIYDERWNNLFINVEKSSEIIKCEIKLKELVKVQSGIISESQSLAAHKKERMARILTLTTEAFENNNDKAKKEMQDCEKEVKKVNKRVEVINKERENIPDLINRANLKLLEETVKLVYLQMRVNQKRVKELELLIDETHKKIKDYIDEKGTLEKDDTDTYYFFHDLLGAEELEKLDKELGSC